MYMYMHLEEVLVEGVNPCSQSTHPSRPLSSMDVDHVTCSTESIYITIMHLHVHVHV